MKNLMETMLLIQERQLVQEQDPETNKELIKLRKQIPPPILGHFDRLVDHGKKAVAIVRNQTCSGCRMLIPIGMISVLKRNEDIHLCATCGRYLLLQDEPEVPTPPPAAKKKRGRPPKAKA